MVNDGQWFFDASFIHLLLDETVKDNCSTLKLPVQRCKLLIACLFPNACTCVDLQASNRFLPADCRKHLRFRGDANVNL